MMQKKSMELAFDGKVVRVSWYAGASDASIHKAAVAALGLPEGAALILRDSDGDVIAISDSLPSGLKLRAELPAAAAPASQQQQQQQQQQQAPAPAAAVQPRGPKAYPLVGNLPELATKGGLASALSRLTREYGDFVRLTGPMGQVFINSDADVVQDMLNRPQDFPKMVSLSGTPLRKLRQETPAGTGLFTSDDTDEMWHVAHRILLPALGLGALKQYYPRMLEVADDLLRHLERLGPTEPCLITDLMTRMTFEAISYTGFNTRWGCIDSPQQPPFVQAMVDALSASMESFTSILPAFFHPSVQKKRDRANTVLLESVDRIIRERRAALERGEAVPNDILQAMLTTRDKVTGQRLPDDNIRAQLITFLIAGHETTSGMLSYALHAVSTTPEVERKLIAEADAVLGRDYSYRPSFADIEKLDYTLRVLKEALRLQPTAPAFGRVCVRDTVVAGKYAIAKGSSIVTYLPALHRNPRFWGSDSEKFEPDRFLPEAVAARHPDAYHPFGIGMRSCIGFQFALIEAKMVMARLYQRLVPRLAKADYKLEHIQTLTVKPKDLYMVLSHRQEEPGHGPRVAESAAAPVAAVAAPVAGPGLHILYGSNMGACQELAQELGRKARTRGYQASVAELDAHAADFPGLVAGPVIIVTSTYNGSPPDNATRFAAWLGRGDLAADACKGLSYTVLGCGNKQWKATFQKFPRWVAERLQALGGEPFHATGTCDADGDFEAAAEAWCEELWPALAQRLGRNETAAPIPTGPHPTEDEALLYRVEVINFAGTGNDAAPPSRFPLHEQAFFTTVTKNEELQAADSGRSTRHIEIALPAGVRYAAGDHLGVFPENPPALVNAVAERCRARLTDVVILRSRSDAGASGEALPCGIPISVFDLLTYHIDLAGPLSRKELRALARSCPCPPERAPLLALCEDAAFKAEVQEAKLGLLELLQRYKSVGCELPLLLSLRPLLKPRYYSISSSPRELAHSCSITVGVHCCARRDGSTLEGLCSHYLLGLAPGQSVRVVVKDTRSSFRLPEDATRPVILIGPGTGLAPLRGFIQERAAQRRAGVPVGATVLFFGCRQPAHDYLYRRELEGYEKDGTLSGLHVAFSREPGQPKVYVQGHVRSQAAELCALLDQGAYVYVCGDARNMAPDVQAAFTAILQEQYQLSAEQAAARVEQLRSEGRYLQDVWAST
jgi:cytochrome P450/NADPH-cytochrome P450 reductase